MNGGRPLRVGDIVRPVHPQLGPEEPGIVAGFRRDPDAIDLWRDMSEAVEVRIRHADGTAKIYVVIETWRMEPVAATFLPVP